MQILIEIIGLATLANVFSWHGDKITSFLMYKLKLDFKPFNCNVCLAFWFGFIWVFFSTLDPISAIIFGGTCYLASHLIFLLLSKNKI